MMESYSFPTMLLTSHLFVLTKILCGLDGLGKMQCSHSRFNTVAGHFISNNEMHVSDKNLKIFKVTETKLNIY